MKPHMEITLTNGGVMLVDADDLPLVSGFSWHWVSRTAGGNVVKYAETTKKKNKIKFQALAHRLVMSPDPGFVVDHINGNGLDNRRGNLRICRQGENARNRRHSIKRRSCFKGVAIRADTGKWRARIMVDRHEINLGCFDTAIDAAAAYNAAALKYFGIFAHLNDLSIFGPTPQEAA